MFIIVVVVVVFIVDFIKAIAFKNYKIKINLKM